MLPRFHLLPPQALRWDITAIGSADELPQGAVLLRRWVFALRGRSELVKEWNLPRLTVAGAPATLFGWTGEELLEKTRQQDG
jgi:hypothetical protein